MDSHQQQQQCTNANPSSASCSAARGASGSSSASSSNTGDCPSSGASAAGPLPCPFACLGCKFTCSQLQKWVDHANGHKPDLSLHDDSALWAELVWQAKLDEVLW